MSRTTPELDTDTLSTSIHRDHSPTHPPTHPEPLNPQIPRVLDHDEKMKTPPRESAKSHKSLEQCKDKALQRFLSETKGRREGLIARYRSCPQSGRSELIKTWLLLQQPPASPARDGNVLMPEELDWEGFLDSVQYEELLLELEGVMMDDIAAEEAAAQEDCSMEEDEQNMMDEESADPDAVLCPVCWASSLIWNSGTLCLHCSCGAWVNLAHSHLTPQGFRSALGEVFDRHYIYCASQGGSSAGQGLRCSMQAAGQLAAQCSTCGWNQMVV